MIAVLCLLAEGFFSGSEIAIVSMDRAKLRYLVQKGSRRARTLSRILENPEWLLSATLLGTNLTITALNAVVTLFVIDRFGSDYELFTILVTAPLILMFGEAIPKAIFQRYSDKIAPHLVYPLQIFSWILSPLVASVAGIAKLVTYICGVQSKKKTPFITREELELVFSAYENPQGVKNLERQMIDRIFSFKDRQVKEIMIPLVEVISVSEDTTLEEAASKMKQSGYSRLPVYSARVDHMKGWISHYDLLVTKDRSRKVSEFLRRIRFVPSTIPVSRLLVVMQRRGDSLVGVVNEYGGVIGILTMEDLLEEVVGDIEDEYDVLSPLVRKIGHNRLTVSARIPIDKLNSVLFEQIPLGDYETLGGFLLTRMQKVPSVGERYHYRKVVFEIVKADDRGIEEVEVIQS